MSPLTQSNPSPIPNPTGLPRSKSARNRPPPFSDENHMPEINRSKNHHQRVKQQNGEPGSAFGRLIRAVFRKPKKRRVNGCDEEANDAVFKRLLGFCNSIGYGILQLNNGLARTPQMGDVVSNVEAEKSFNFSNVVLLLLSPSEIMQYWRAEKAKEKVELMPQELNKSQIRVEELTNDLLEEKELTKSIRIDLEKYENVIDKFYHIRQCSLSSFTDASLEEKCECLMHNSDEMWRFQNDEDTSTSNYIIQNSLEAEIVNLREGVVNLQNKLQVILAAKNIKERILALQHNHSQYKINITDLLGEGYSELKSLNDAVLEKMRQLETMYL
ncbi:hypothetical protein CASFOL_012332 [Castilleja foliolosa]|uniref:Uncharacterized protein n=1 Tax=Castilleja foliolosa TaxID=1961234 RepID=A0ABD3DQ18_9LAMI